MAKIDFFSALGLRNLDEKVYLFKFWQWIPKFVSEIEQESMSEMYPDFRTVPLGVIFLKLSRQLTA